MKITDHVQRENLFAGLILIGLFIFPIFCDAVERATPTAPDKYLKMKNPMPLSPAVLEEAEAIYKKKCRKCHGTNGNGKGSATKGMKVKPRNYTDKALMEKIPDGQLFWIILDGSDPETTEMESFKGKITEEETWELIHYIRSLAK